MFVGSVNGIIAYDDFRSYGVEDALSIDGIFRLCTQSNFSLGSILSLVVGVNPGTIGCAIHIFRDRIHFAIFALHDEMTRGRAMIDGTIAPSRQNNASNFV